MKLKKPKLIKIEKGKPNFKRFLRKNWALILAIVYFLVPLDIIPDIIPVFGFGDDILVLAATLFINYRKHFRKDKNKIVEGELVDD